MQLASIKNKPKNGGTSEDYFQQTDRTAKPYNRLFMEVAYGALTLTGFEYEHLGKVFCFSRALVT